MTVPDRRPLAEVLAQEAPPGQEPVTPFTACLAVNGEPVVVLWVGERTAAIKLAGDLERQLAPTSHLWVDPSTIAWRDRPWKVARDYWRDGTRPPRSRP